MFPLSVKLKPGKFNDRLIVAAHPLWNGLWSGPSSSSVGWSEDCLPFVATCEPQ